ncbi:MAG TPA: GvpL/GvpF family gas vesicle protein [Solirubrobacterales bacterium]
MLYVYAITDPGASTEAPGIGGARVTAVREGDLQALVSAHERLEPATGVDRLWEHEAVVEGAGAGGAGVLPLRLDSALAGEDEVRALLRERADEFGTVLRRVRGAAELSVRVGLAVAEEPAPVAPGTGGAGTAYMLGRLERARRAEDLVRAVHEPLAELAREHARLGPTLSDRRGQFRLAYLVERGAVEPFRARVEELAESQPELQLTCTGPWPPYSFVGSAA